jgi:hypothetical protein
VAQDKPHRYKTRDGSYETGGGRKKPHTPMRG